MSCQQLNEKILHKTFLSVFPSQKSLRNREKEQSTWTVPMSHTNLLTELGPGGLHTAPQRAAAHCGPGSGSHRCLKVQRCTPAILEPPHTTNTRATPGCLPAWPQAGSPASREALGSAASSSHTKTCCPDCSARVPRQYRQHSSQSDSGSALSL